MWYSVPFSEPFHEIYLGLTTIIGLVSNGLLVYTLIHCKGNSLGGYKFLLAFFAFCDAAVSLTHRIVQPMAGISSTGFYLFSHTAASNPFPNRDLNFLSCWIFTAFFYQTFVVLVFHFVYRYQALTGSFGPLSHASNRRSWLVAGIIFNIIFMSFMLFGVWNVRDNDFTRSRVPQEANDFFPGVNLSSGRMGYLNALFWEVDLATGEVIRFHTATLVTSCIVMGLIFGSVSIVIGCTVGIVRMLSSATMSSRTRILQHQLFRALLVQTAIPFGFSYLPVCFIFVVPLMGQQIGAAASIPMMFTAIFPAIDAFFIIGFIAQLRAVLFGSQKKAKIVSLSINTAMSTLTE